MERYVRLGVGVATVMLGHLGAQRAHAEWHYFSSSRNGSTYLIDPERVRTVAGKRQVWVKGDHSRDRGEQARSSMMLLSIDCSALTFRILAGNRYDSYGKTISSFSDPDYGVGYKPVAPETIADDVAQLVCPKDGEGA